MDAGAARRGGGDESAPSRPHRTRRERREAVDDREAGTRARDDGERAASVHSIDSGSKGCSWTTGLGNEFPSVGKEFPSVGNESPSMGKAIPGMGKPFRGSRRSPQLFA